MTEKEERLLPLPNANDLQTAPPDYPSSYAPFYDDDSFEEKRSIREYLHVVYKRLPIILAITFFVTAVVAFYMYSQPSIYQSNLTMIIEPRKPSPTSKEININFGNDLNYYNTQLQLLRNFDLMREVVVRLNLHKEPDLFNKGEKGIASTFRLMFSGEKEKQGNKNALPVISDDTAATNTPSLANLPPEEKTRTDTYAGILLSGMIVDQRPGTNLVDITVNSEDPLVSAAVANKIAEVFIEQDIARETEGAKKTLIDLSKSIEELNATIANQQQALNNAQAGIDSPLLGERGQEFNASKLQQLSTQLFEAQDTRRKLEADYNAAQRANASGEILAVVANNPMVAELRSRLNENKAKVEQLKQDLRSKIQAKEAEKSNLLARYTPEYTPVKQITEEIEQLRKTLADVEKRSAESSTLEEKDLRQKVAREVLTGLAAEVAAARNREAQIQRAYNAEEATANRQGLQATKLTTLIRELDSNRQLYDTYIQRQKEQELTVASSRPDNIKISAVAQASPQPIGPQRSRNILIALFLSLAGGVGLSFLLDYLDDTVKSSDDIGKFLGLPTLALIPYQSNSEKRKLNVISGKGAGGTSTALVTLENNRSPMAEAYRHLRTSLLFSSAGKPPQTMLITSSQPAEGKTTTAINTAVTLAQSGVEVVIIDCDLRRPRLHNYFGLENTSGLTNYISGEKNPENLVKTYKDLPNLKIITSGPIPPNPAELLSSNEMKNLLEMLKGRYKHILIDSPPAISFTDAAILSTLVDGVVLVAMAGKSSLHLVRRFKHRLNSLGARIYGVVLNGVKSNSVEYGYYGYGYAYNYYANAADDDSTPRMEEVETVSSIHDTKG